MKGETNLTNYITEQHLICSKCYWEEQCCSDKEFNKIDDCNHFTPLNTDKILTEYDIYTKLSINIYAEIVCEMSGNIEI